MLENHWYIACPSRKLKNRPLALDIFGKRLVFFRDASGRPAALDDCCPHRNAPLSAGKVRQGKLACPYHGWRFNGDGALDEIPYVAGEPPACRMSAYPCVEQDGYVWVCPGGQTPEQAPLAFPHLDLPGWTSFRMETLFQGNVEACLENFLDCPHATHVHRYWFRTPTAKPVKAVIRMLDDGAVTEYFEEPREKSLVWSLLSPGKTVSMQHTDRYIVPATSRVDYEFGDGRAYSITSSCTPVDDSHTRVFTVISFRRGWLGPFIRLFFHPLSRLIIHQDVRMLAQVQENIQRRGGADFMALEQDVLFRPINEWRKALREGSTPPQAGQQWQVELKL